MAEVEPRRRAGWGTITREQVVSAAARAVGLGRYEQMTIRSLAADLGVSPMSLYRHVRDKDDLLDEVVDRLFAQHWRPEADRGDWMAWVGEAAERFRDFLVTQPAALHVYLAHPVVSTTAISRMETVLEVLRSAGFDEEGAGRAHAAVHTYTIGFAALQASRARSAPKETALSEIEKRLATFTAPQQFSEGLAYLLGGMERQRRAGEPPHR